MNYGPVFWREKGTKQWFTGHVCEFCGNKVRIGLFIHAPENASKWYDRNDIEVVERRG